MNDDHLDLEGTLMSNSGKAVLCFWFSILLWLGSLPAYSQSTMEEWMETAQRYHRWDIEVQGTVRDQKNRPLSDVYCTARILKMSSWMSHSDKFQDTVSGQYHFEFEKAMNVEISFLKEGYSMKSILLNPGRPDQDAQVDLDRKKVVYTRDIVLYDTSQMRDTSTLYWDLSSTNQEGNKEVVNLESVDYPELPESLVVSVDSPTSPSVYLDIILEDDPAIEPLTIEWSNLILEKSPPGKRVYLHLESPNPEDGLVLIEHRFTNYAGESFPSEMLIAPESGYVDRIEIPQFYFQREHPGQAGNKLFLYFMLKADGRYAKCQLYSIGFGSRSRFVLADVEAHYQFDGSRNLP